MTALWVVSLEEWLTAAPIGSYPPRCWVDCLSPNAVTLAGYVGAEGRKCAAFAQVVPVAWGKVFIIECEEGPSGRAFEQPSPTRRRPC